MPYKPMRSHQAHILHNQEVLSLLISTLFSGLSSSANETTMLQLFNRNHTEMSLKISVGKKKKKSLTVMKKCRGSAAKCCSGAISIPSLSKLRFGADLANWIKTDLSRAIRESRGEKFVKEKLFHGKQAELILCSYRNLNLLKIITTTTKKKKKHQQQMEATV